MQTATLTSPRPLPRLALPDLRALHRAYRAACAAVDLAGQGAADHSEEEGARLVARKADAVNAFMLAPAGDLTDLANKLAAFRDDDLREWYLADEMVSVMATDARRLADLHR